MHKITERLKKNIKDNLIDILISVIVFEALGMIAFVKWVETDIEKFTSFLFQFSSIFSAIVLTVIISKVFGQRQENAKRKQEIIEISNKISDLRRISKILIDNDGIWPTGLKTILRRDYSQLDYHTLQSQSLIEGSEKFNLQLQYINDQRFNKTIGDLFISLKTIQGDVTERGLFLYTNYDFNYTYNFEIVNQWTEFHTANTLWYSFENKYNLIRNRIHINNLRSDSLNEIRHLAYKINSGKYSDFSKPIEKVLASIGTDFDSFYFSKIRYLLYENREILPESVRFSFSTMLAVMIFGVLIPLFFQAIKLDNPWYLKADLLIFISVISIFLIRFKKILIRELRV